MSQNRPNKNNENPDQASAPDVTQQAASKSGTDPTKGQAQVPPASDQPVHEAPAASGEDADHSAQTADQTLAASGDGSSQVLAQPIEFTGKPETIATRHGMFGVHDAGDTTGFGGLQQTFVVSKPATRPYGGWFDDAVDILSELLQADGIKPEDAIEKVVVEHEQLVLFIAREHLLEVAQHLRDDQDLRFELCIGCNGVHYPADQGRELHAVYPLISVTHNHVIRLEVTCPDADPHIPSIVSIYPGNDWQERETWDLMGIVFDGHPSLTRTAMPSDWVGHPQRKDYPLGGIPVEYKGATVPPADTRRLYN